MSGECEDCGEHTLECSCKAALQLNKEEVQMIIRLVRNAVVAREQLQQFKEAQKFREISLKLVNYQEKADG
jgi:hypothetical protein